MAMLQHLCLLRVQIIKDINLEGRNMKVINIKDLPSILDKISAKKVYSDTNIEIIQIELLPNEVIPVHKNKDTALFNIIKGAGVVSIDGEDYVVTNGNFITIEKNRDREWVNNGNTPLVIVVTKLLS